MRDPAASLYDSACELIDTARVLHDRLRRPGSLEALAPTLGALQEALEELAAAHATARPGAGHEVDAALEALSEALAAAARAADEARSAAAQTTAAR